MLLPTPAMRRLWIEASAAGHRLKEIRTLEEKGTSRFVDPSELLMFTEEILLGPLLEFLGVDGLLAQVVENFATERRSLEGPPAFPTVSTESEGRAELSRASPPNGLNRVWSGLPQQANSSKSATSGEKSTGRGPGLNNNGPSLADREQISAGQVFSISRDETRDYFTDLSEQAGVRSAWDDQVVVMPDQKADDVSTISAAAAKDGPSLDPETASPPTRGMRKLPMGASAAGKASPNASSESEGRGEISPASPPNGLNRVWSRPQRQANSSEASTSGGKSTGSGLGWNNNDPSPAEREQISARRVFSISRDEARDYFTDLFEQAGVRSAWDDHVVVVPDQKADDVSTISAAGKASRQIRKLEEGNSELVRPTSELLTLDEKNVRCQLAELSNLEKAVAGVLSNAVGEENWHAESRSASHAVSTELSRHWKANIATAPASVVMRRQLSNDTSVGTGARDQFVESIRSERGAISNDPSGHERQPEPVRQLGIISRAQARDHFAVRAEHAGARSAWDELVVAAAPEEFYLGGFSSDGAAATGAGISKDGSSTPQKKSVAELLSSARAFSPRSLLPEDVAAGTRSRPAALRSNDFRNGDHESASNGTAETDHPREQLLGPLIESAVRSVQQRASQSLPACEDDLIRAHGRSEMRAGKVENEAPLTGLRRLAARGMTMQSVVTDSQNIARSQLWPSQISALFDAYGGEHGEDANFALQLTEFLRRETRRQGIAMEGADS